MAFEEIWDYDHEIEDGPLFQLEVDDSDDDDWEWEYCKFCHRDLTWRETDRGVCSTCEAKED